MAVNKQIISALRALGDTPVGTPEELLEFAGGDEEMEALLLRHVPTCSSTIVTNGKNAGCAFYSDCDCQFKGDGPRNGGERIIKRNGAVVQNAVACYTHIHHRENYNDNDGFVEWIANEGDTIEVSGTERIADPSVPGGFRNEPSDTIKLTIKPHPRLRDRKELKNIVRLIELRKAEQGKVLAQRKTMALGGRIEDAPEGAGAVAAAASGDRGKKQG